MNITSVERWLHRTSMQVRAFFRGGRLDRELDEELGYHLDRLIEDNVARGLTPDAARRRVHRAGVARSPFERRWAPVAVG